MESDKLAGWNAGYYRRHFERMQRAQKSWLPGWNWAVFLHSTGWFWYRRMYGWSLLNLIAPVALLLLVVIAMQQLVPDNDMQLPLAVAGAAYVLLVFGLLPLYADSLYLYRLRKDGKVPRPPSIMTIVGALLIIVIPAFMTYAVVEAQRDYYQRSRISKSLAIAYSIKALVDEFYQAQKRLPGSQEAVQFRHKEPMKYASSVGWDPARRAIVVTMDEQFDSKRFEIAAEEKEGALEWTCRSIDLDPQRLPSSCR